MTIHIVRFRVSPTFNMELILLDLQKKSYPKQKEEDLLMGFAR